MPNITVEGPKIKDLEVKRALIKEVTEAAVKAYKLPPAVIVAVIKENAPENVGVGGQLICDRKQAGHT
ncbi:MAG: tautomerase family protein [Candidatus Omnitrophica bacterium]|nr:tautomerase family protein [Candidatus Omnitrophota bacterium]